MHGERPPEGEAEVLDIIAVRSLKADSNRTAKRLVRQLTEALKKCING